jgi:hypothetical protein
MMLMRKEHLTQKGLISIVNIRASLNLGLSEGVPTSGLKEAFPNVVPVKRPLVEDQVIRDSQWLAGFTSGEGCFFINTVRSKAHSLGYQIRLRFLLGQHSRDELLIRSLVEYFDCGNIYLRRNKEVVEYCVDKYSDLTEKIIPFFNKYPILGVKNQDFKDFCRVVSLIKEKKDKTPLGLEEILEIQAGMNLGRLN